MKRYFIIVAIVLISACKTAVLRKQIKGAVFNKETGKPIPEAGLKSFNGDLLIKADSSGSFTIPAITKSVLLFPGSEKDELAPHSDKIIINASGFKSDTVFIYQPGYKTDADVIYTGSIYLKPLP